MAAVIDTERELLQILGPSLDMEVDPVLIRAMEKSADFPMHLDPNSNSGMHEDGFQKAQYELLVDQQNEQQLGLQYQEQQKEELYATLNISSEGHLMPLDFEHSQETQQHLGNNGNQPRIGFQPMNDNWMPLAPAQPEEVPMIAAEPVDDFQAQIQKEKNKIYSALCLKKKKETRQNAKKVDGELKAVVEMKRNQNEIEERLLCFTVQCVLPPFLGGNNQVLDPTEVSEQVQYYEATKEQIVQTTDNNRDNNENVIKTHQALLAAQNKVADTEYDLRNKAQRAIELGVSENTFGSRNTRAKQAMEKCAYEHSIEWNKFELEKQRRLSDLLDYTWNYFRFPVSQILMNSHNLYDYLKQTEQDYMSRLHSFLFPDPG